MFGAAHGEGVDGETARGDVLGAVEDDGEARGDVSKFDWCADSAASGGGVEARWGETFVFFQSFKVSRTDQKIGEASGRWATRTRKLVFGIWIALGFRRDARR